MLNVLHEIIISDGRFTGLKSNSILLVFSLLLLLPILRLYYCESSIEMNLRHSKSSGRLAMRILTTGKPTSKNLHIASRSTLIKSDSIHSSTLPPKPHRSSLITDAICNRRLTVSRWVCSWCGEATLALTPPFLKARNAVESRK